MMSLLISVGIGGALGAMLGYFGQCSSGSCPLTATWWRGALYGAIVGLVVYASSGGGGSARMNQSTTNVVKVSEQEFTQAVQQATQPVVVDFYATWCGPCKAMSPVLEEVAAQFAGRVRFVKVNVDESPELASRYGIQGVPTLMLFQKGRPVDTWVGMMPREDLVARLQSTLDDAQTVMRQKVADEIEATR